VAVAAGFFAAVITGFADFLATAFGAMDGFALVAGFDAMVANRPLFYGPLNRITRHAGKQALKVHGQKTIEPVVTGRSRF
jgi:hypothetical protein